MTSPSRPPWKPVCRARPSRALKARILEGQNFLCLACERALDEVEFDHIIPLGLGGANAPDNWAALCRACHRRKTADDLKRMAKAKRQRRFHETGRSRPPSTAAPFGAPARFNTAWRRHVDGMGSRRCDCSDCVRKERQRGSAKPSGTGA